MVCGADVLVHTTFKALTRLVRQVAPTQFRQMHSLRKQNRRAVQIHAQAGYLVVLLAIVKLKHQSYPKLLLLAFQARDIVSTKSHALVMLCTGDCVPAACTNRHH